MEKCKELNTGRKNENEGMKEGERKRSEEREKNK